MYLSLILHKIIHVKAGLQIETWQPRDKNICCYNTEDSEPAAIRKRGSGYCISMETAIPTTEISKNFTTQPTIFPRSGYSILAFLMFLNAAFSIFNNLLVILVTMKYPQLRNPINIFILNLSFSDLLMTLCGTTIVISTNYHGYFYLGEKFCIFQGFAVNYFGKISFLL